MLMRFVSSALGVVFLACTATGCQRLDERRAGGLPMTPLGISTAIPFELGDLVAVTAVPGSEQSVHLWFVKPDKTISVVGMNVVTRHLGTGVVTIERR